MYSINEGKAFHARARRAWNHRIKVPFLEHRRSSRFGADSSQITACGAKSGVYLSSMKNAYPIELIVRTSLESMPIGGSHNHGAARLADRAFLPTGMPLQLLKRQMLVSALERTNDAGLFKRLCGAANQAANLAWETNAPALTFPTFFEELVRSICAHRS
jgi:hypothetical protein